MGVVVLTLSAGMLAGASGAQAATLQATCSTNPTTDDLQAQLNAAASGDTVELTGLCSANYTLPAGAAFTLEAAPGTTSGFNGSGEQLDASASAIAGMTLSGLMFENGGSASSGAVDLYHVGGTLTLSADTFQNETGEGYTPAVSIATGSGVSNCTAPDGSLTITGSHFTSDSEGALSVQIDCPFDATTLSGNTFSHNVFAGPSSQTYVAGAALNLYLFPPAYTTAYPTVTQQGNTFVDNSVTTPRTTGYFGGGAEFAQGIDLDSTGDVFVGNSIPGSSGSGFWAWGGALGILASNCAMPPPMTQSALADDVFTGNQIIEQTGDDPAYAQGAAIYVGCGGDSTIGNHLSVLDSTITGNNVSGGTSASVAGIDGGPIDQLVLGNTILYGDTGGSELSGFDGSGGSLAATYSDVCASGTTPLAGAGNLCASPGLTGTDGAQETASSPTVDKGSNALVPASLTTDVFGDPRIQPGSAGCGTAPPAIVDVGADELIPIALPCIPPPGPAPTPAPPKFAIVKVKVLAHDVIELILTPPGTGTLRATGTITITVSVTGKKHKHKHKHKTITFGSAHATATRAGLDVTLKLSPGKKARKLLKKAGRTVKLKVTFTPTSGKAASLSAKAHAGRLATAHKRRRR